jgi:type I restriction enzyme S subunit
MSNLPKGWIKCQLGDVVEYGKTNKVEPINIPENAWMLELEDIEKDTSKLLKRLSFSERLSKSTKNYFNKGDVLYGKLRPYLNKVIIADQDGLCTTEIVPINPNSIVDGWYLFYWFKYSEFLKYVESVSHGIQMPRLGTEAGLKAPFRLAPLAEQKRIVTKLDSLFAYTRRARQELDHIPKLIERYKQAILSAAFRGDLTADWRKENLLIEEWKELALKEFLSEPLSNGRSVCDGDGFPVLRLTCLKDRLIDLNENKKGMWSREEALKFLVCTKDFFVSRGNGSLSLVGKGSLVGVVTDEIAYPDTLIRVRVKPEVYNVEFLSFIWNSYSIRRQIEKAAKTTAGIYKINQKSIENFIFPIPSLQEQQEIVEKLKKYFQAIDRLEQEYQKAMKFLDRLEQSTLAKAFRGEIVPQDPNDEPASILLERIQKERENQQTPKKRQLSLFKEKT